MGQFVLGTSGNSKGKLKSIVLNINHTWFHSELTSLVKNEWQAHCSTQKLVRVGECRGGGRNIPLCNVSGGEGRSRIDVTSTKHHQKLASTCSNITNSNLPRLSLHQKYHIWWYIFISKVTFEACKISTSKIRLSRPWMTDRGQILFFWYLTYHMLLKIPLRETTSRCKLTK